MKNIVLAAVAALGIAGSTFAYDAYAAGEPPKPRMEEMQQRFQTMLDAHLAGFKAGLKLTADQDKLWAPFESAIRDAAKMRRDDMMKMHEMMGKDGARPSPIDHMLGMSDELGKMSTELKQVADAGKPLYDSLSEAQKRDFGPLLHDLLPRHHGHGGHGGPGPDGAGPEDME